MADKRKAAYWYSYRRKDRSIVEGHISAIYQGSDSMLHTAVKKLGEFYSNLSELTDCTDQREETQLSVDNESSSHFLQDDHYHQYLSVQDSQSSVDVDSFSENPPYLSDSDSDIDDDVDIDFVREKEFVCLRLNVLCR
ncbi:hypothetical protein DPMN_144568 [Dreissena polymorpha]|uniref:Uncharacterized protein n=1 Tax=Dreissena polymorpha TaxID=45954 RepID=A0A9D4GII6_DREPO|nr:hypothetical protein DPMN_144568 [Dreissena polymorpha]